MRAHWGVAVAVFVATTCSAPAEKPPPDTGPVEDRLPFAETTQPTEPPTVATTAPPTTARPATTVRPATTTPTTAGAYYSSCAEARSAGAAPLHRGEPGYRSELDRDGDGVACE